jgi:hypothetical protein
LISASFVIKRWLPAQGSSFFSAQEPAGLADEHHIFFGKFHLDDGNLPRQAP